MNNSDLSKESHIYNQGLSSAITSLNSNPVDLFQITNPSGPSTTIGSKGLINLINTGLISGCAVTVASGTQVNIASGVARFTNNTTDPSNPTYQDVTITAKTNVTITNVALAPLTVLFIDSSNNVIQSTDPNNYANMRQYCFIGFVFHPNATILSISNTCTNEINLFTDLRDLTQNLGPVNISGNIFSANGANMFINKSAGSQYLLGGNYKTDKTNPNTLSQGALTGATFRYCYQSGGGSISFSAGGLSIDPTKYDNGSGVLQTVPVGGWTNQRIYIVPSTNDVFIQYGQQVYPSAQSALSALFSESVNALPGFNNLSLRGTLTVIQSATALNNTSQAVFIPANKIGDMGAGYSSANTYLTDDGLPRWQYSTTTTDSDPGFGYFRANNGTLAAASFLYVNISTTFGADLSNTLKYLTTGSQLLLKLKNSPSTFVLFTVTGLVTNATTYLKIPVSWVDQGGSFSNNDNIEWNIYGSVPSSLINVGGVNLIETCKLPNVTGEYGANIVNMYQYFTTGAGPFTISQINIVGRQAALGACVVETSIFSFNHGNVGDPAINKLAAFTVSADFGAIGNRGSATITFSTPLILSPNTSYYTGIAATNDNIVWFAEAGGLASAIDATFQLAGPSANAPATIAAASRNNSGRNVYMALR